MNIDAGTGSADARPLQSPLDVQEGMGGALTDASQLQRKIRNEV
ncbi:hypothetical protein FHR49_003710 [Xanthomonas campestris]